MSKHADSTDSNILRRIESRKSGWVFTPDSFADLGTRQAVDLALMRHRKSGLIRKLARGLYDYPKTDSQTLSLVCYSHLRMTLQTPWQVDMPPVCNPPGPTRPIS